MKNSGLGIASLVCSIIGLLTASARIGIILSIVAFIFALVSFTDKWKKHGVSVAGLVISIFVFLISVGTNSILNKTTNFDKTDSVTTTESEQETTAPSISSYDKEETDTISAVSIDKTCIYNENEVSIYVEGIEDRPLSYNVKFYIENKSSLNLGFNAHAYAVNGIMSGEGKYAMDCDVSAGKQANTYLEIKKGFLTKSKIDIIKSIDILFWAYDNDKNIKEFDTGQITIYTSAYENESYNAQGHTLYDNYGINVKAVSRTNNSFVFALTNQSGSYISFDVDNLSINDFTSSETDFDLMSIITLNNCQEQFTVNISDKFLDTNNIDEIEKIEFTLNVRPHESYFDDWNTDWITLIIDD